MSYALNVESLNGCFLKDTRNNLYHLRDAVKKSDRFRLHAGINLSDAVKVFTDASEEPGKNPGDLPTCHWCIVILDPSGKAYVASQKVPTWIVKALRKHKKKLIIYLEAL